MLRRRLGGKPFKPDPKSHLIWCPNNGRERIATVIDGAKKSLWLQNERYQDTVIVERLVRAVEPRRLGFRIMARAPHKLKGKKLLKASADCESCTTSAPRFIC